MTNYLDLDYDSNPSRFRANVESAQKYSLIADVHDKVAQHLATETKGVILDMGCGEGRFIQPAIKAGLSVVALDYSVTMLRSIANKPLQSDAYQLPFANGTFNGVVGLYMLYHLATPQITIAEAYRVLHPGGLFAATAPSRYNDPELANILPYWGRAESFDAENGPDMIRAVFTDTEEERWDAPLVQLPDKAALKLYLQGRSLSPHEIEVALRKISTPLTLTKRGSLIYGRKSFQKD